MEEGKQRYCSQTRDRERALHSKDGQDEEKRLEIYMDKRWRTETSASSHIHWTI